MNLTSILVLMMHFFDWNEYESQSISYNDGQLRLIGLSRCPMLTCFSYGSQGLLGAMLGESKMPPRGPRGVQNASQGDPSSPKTRYPHEFKLLYAVSETFWGAPGASWNAWYDFMWFFIDLWCQKGWKMTQNRGKIDRKCVKIVCWRRLRLSVCF